MPFDFQLGDKLVDRKRFGDFGVRGLIAKPFDPLRLGSQIAAILGWSK